MSMARPFINQDGGDARSFAGFLSFFFLLLLFQSFISSLLLSLFLSFFLSFFLFGSNKKGERLIEL